MAWSDLITTGRGRIVVLLEITGFRYVLGTDTYTCSESWYSDEGYEAIQPWLEWDVGPIDETIDPLLGFMKCGDLSVRVVDVGGGMIAEIKSRESLNAQAITTSVTAAATTISVADASGFSADDVLHIGQEAFKVGAVSTNDLTGCTRGYLGTTAAVHTLDLTAMPEQQPFVTDGPVRLAGRPCRIRVAVVDEATGTPGNAAVVWRGVIGEEIEVRPESWDIPLLHISNMLSRQVGRGLTSSAIAPQTYWYSGDVWPSLSTTRYFRKTTAGASVLVDVTVTGGLYASQAMLAGDWNVASIAAGSTHWPQIRPSVDTGEYALFCPDSASSYVEVMVREGDVLWALGFEPGTYVQEPGEDMEEKPGDDPRAWVLDLSGRGDARPMVYVDDSSQFTTDLWVVPPNAPYMRVAATTVSGGYDSVSLAPRIMDPVRPTQWYAAVDDGDEEDLILRHAFVFSSHWDTDLDDVEDAIKRSLGHLSGASEPTDWTIPLITSGDVDYTELTAALGGTPSALELFTAVVPEGVEWQELFGPHLGILGVCPRITTDGKIGWARIDTPTTLSAISVEVDEEIWELVESASIAARIGGALMTGVELKYGYDYRTDEWPRPSNIRWYDWAAEAGQQRDECYELRGVTTSTRISALARDRAELDNIIASAVRSTHFGLYGRDAIDVEIPCTYLAWQIRCGDVVLITHPLLPDTTAGAIGVTDRLGFVVGRRLPLAGDDGVGTLTVRIPPTVRASGIAPCARGDSWTVGTLTLTCSDATDPLYAASGGNDLTDLAAVIAAEGNTTVLLWEYDIATPTGSYPLTGTASACNATAKTITFTADPFSGGALPATGVEVTWPAWGSQSTQQKRWLAVADTAYGLGATPDAGYKWGI